MRGKWLFEVGIIHDIAVCHLAIFPWRRGWGHSGGGNSIRNIPEYFFEYFFNKKISHLKLSDRRVALI